MESVVNLLCNSPSPSYLFFSSSVPIFVYLSHFLILIISLFLGIYVYLSDRKNLANNILFLILLFFSGWLIMDSITWSSNDPSIIMFAWATLLFFELAVYVFSFYLMVVVSKKEDISKKWKWLFALILSPAIFLMPTVLNLKGFDLTNCLSVEGSMPLYYNYSLEILFLIGILILTIRNNFKNNQKEDKKNIFKLSLGIWFFLALFTAGNIFGSFTSDWKISQFGLIGMPFFTGFLIYILQQKKKTTIESFTQELYKHNVELAVKNKTLSLLEKLYHTSILALTPEEMGQTITDIIRKDLNLEFSGILIFKKEEDLLEPLAFSKSERLMQTLDKLGFHFKDIKIDKISEHNLFKLVVYSKTISTTDNLEEVWKKLIKLEHIEIIKTESNIKTTLLFPLMTGEEILGVLMLGFNREYETLNTYEKESIKSFINVIALSISKAYLYKDLQDANEKLKSLDKLKTEFLSLASHQLRSPLTAITGYTSMLLEGDFGAVGVKQKEAIDRVFQSSKHLTVVVEDLLNVAKIEQGGMQYVMKPFDFEKIASDMAKDLSVTAENKGLKLTFNTDKNGPYNVNGDMEKIRQVVLNFIDNAIKYTKKGTIEVKLEKDEKKKKMIFSVTDTGMGIPPEIKDTLFTKFVRGVGGKMDSSGTGLGLYLAKEIIGAHKGKVWAESEGTGKGSSFFIELDTV